VGVQDRSLWKGADSFNVVVFCTCTQTNVGWVDILFLLRSKKRDRYKTQVDVIRQLGFKIEAGLRQEEQVMQSLPRNDAARSRATHVKLTRDFRRVEQGFKNLQLEARRKKSAATVAREQQHQHTEETNDESNQLRQMQLQQDSINAEIMREREEEIRNINKGMHTVNEIYKVRQV
jgi:ABC-type phosphate transport system auxiliary subunit